MTVVALDDPGIDQALYRALAPGATHAVKLTTAGGGWIDSHRRAELIASWIRTQPYDLVVSGVQAPDDVDGQLPVLLAALLGHPHASVVVGVEATDTGVAVIQQFGGGRIGELELPLPAVLGVQVSLRDPRYVSEMRVRLAARGGGVEAVPAAMGTLRSGLTVRRLFRPEASRRAEMLPGTADEAAGAGGALSIRCGLPLAAYAIDVVAEGDGIVATSQLFHGKLLAELVLEGGRGICDALELLQALTARARN